MPKRLIDLETYNSFEKNINENSEEIRIQNLKINEIHFKTFLILKIVNKIFHVDSLNFIGEDCNKEIINVIDMMQ